VEFRSLSNLARFRDLISVLVRYGFDDMVERLDIPGMGMVQRIHPVNPDLTPYQRIRLALEELGPTFVKFGQIMSLRPDLLPRPLTLELQKLQDEVAPLDFDTILPVLEDGLGGPLSDRFSRFEKVPTASASLSQVHRAVLKPGGDVVAVKIQRPGIRSVIESDLGILQTFVRQIHERVDRLRIYDLPNIVRVTRRLLIRELDFLREATNMRIARSLLEDGVGIRIPRVYPDLCTEKLLIMEFVQGKRLREVEPETIDRPKDLAAKGLRSAVEQILEHGFFHADPHPGNVLLTQEGMFCLLDWGMVGRLSRNDRFRIIDLIHAVVDSDSQRLAECLLQIASSEDPPDQSALERDLLDILDTFYTVPLKRLNLGQIMLDIAALLRAHKLRLPSDFVIMIKALITAEGTARHIYPDLDVVAEAEGLVRKAAARRHSPKALWRDLTGTLNRLKALSRVLPEQIGRILGKTDRGDLSIRLEHENLGPLRRTLNNMSNRLTLGIIIGSMIIGSSMIITTGVEPFLFGYPLLGILGYLISGVLGLWLVFTILRSRRF